VNDNTHRKNPYPLTFLAVIAGLSRSKNGVAALAYIPAIPISKALF
jgi:hypothetical protein